jgi:hypothetical protein
MNADTDLKEIAESSLIRPHEGFWNLEKPSFDRRIIPHLIEALI